jgi:hypothetical protein
VDTDDLRIDAGNNAPTPVINSPAASKLFRVGETITLTGSATDPEDGVLPASALTWEVTRHHDTQHPVRNAGCLCAVRRLIPNQ